MASHNTKIGAHFLLLFCWLLRLDCCGSKGARCKQQKKSPPQKIAALWCPSVGRSGGPVFPAVSSAGWRVCYLHTITPPPSRSTANTAPHICRVTSTMYCCCSKKENVILLKNNASIARHPSGRAPLTSLPRNARDFPPVYCPYFCYWLAAARHPGFQPLSPPPNLHSPPVQPVLRRTSQGG